MVQPPPISADPEFRPTLSERSLPPVVHPGSYRRILANPFLGFLAVGAWVVAVGELLFNSGRSPLSTLPTLLLLALAAVFLPRLFQYHCLDCGRTGRLSRWKQHACPSVALRIVQGKPRRFRGPGPLAQTLLWAYVLVVVLILAKLSGLTSR